MITNWPNIIGTKYARLTVLERPTRRASKTKPNVIYTFVKCRCDCGNVGEYHLNAIKNRKYSSCGCLKRELAKERYTIHGKRNHTLYRRWKNMRQRCNNPNNPRYKDWGGRGIRVCDEWQKSYLSFFNWSIANGYKKELELDRINNNGNYEPSNCRYVTHQQNCSNQRTTKLSIEKANEIRMARIDNISEMSRRFKLSRGTITRVLNNEAWV